MSQTKNYIGASLIALAVFLAWVLVLPSYNKISVLREAIKERENLLSARNAIIANLKSLTAEYQKRAGDIAKLSSVIPNKKSVAELVSTMENIASRNGMQLTGGTISEQSAEAGKQYGMLLLDFNFSGNYLSLDGLLNNIEKNLRLLDVAFIDISPSSFGASSLLDFRVRINAYFLGPDNKKTGN
ncbi:MAG: hypothetical protein UY24_C0022G0007 [Parcubacteria group bacterium GW2011_GWA1_48_11b]|nr:MAG: hypothetical protein UY24_C0022G0007 [Parcubacteria group bacterium GW2011_GWA1_48_11b]